MCWILVCCLVVSACAQRHTADADLLSYYQVADAYLMDRAHLVQYADLQSRAIPDFPRYPLDDHYIHDCLVLVHGKTVTDYISCHYAMDALVVFDRHYYPAYTLSALARVEHLGEAPRSQCVNCHYLLYDASLGQVEGADSVPWFIHSSSAPG